LNETGGVCTPTAFIDKEQEQYKNKAAKSTKRSSRRGQLRYKKGN